MPNKICVGAIVLDFVESDCYNLTTKEKVPKLEFNHAVADNIIFYSNAQVKMKGQDAVVIDAEDTDVVVLAAHESLKIHGLVGIRQKKNMFDCH